jgi:hypothetical protein
MWELIYSYFRKRRRKRKFWAVTMMNRRLPLIIAR